MRVLTHPHRQSAQRHMELAVSHTHPSSGFLGIKLLMQATPLREAIELIANVPRLLAERVLEVQHGPLGAVYDAF